MGEIAENIKTEISKIQDSENDTRNIQSQFIEADDIQTVEQVQLAGFESNPPVGTKHLVKDLGGGWKQSFAENDGVAPDATLLEGESKIYSSDGGTVKSFVILRKDGNIELNGTGDFAVRFSKLEEAYNQLKDDHDAQITAYNSLVTELKLHVHPGVTSGGASTLVTTGITAGTENPSTGDIAAAKIDTIKVPA